MSNTKDKAEKEFGDRQRYKELASKGFSDVQIAKVMNISNSYLIERKGYYKNKGEFND